MSQPVKLADFLDLYPRRNGKFELNNKQDAIISLGHFGGQFDWPDATEEQRARIYQDHLDYTLGLLRFLATDEAVPANVRAEMRSLGLHKNEFADNGNLPYQLYVREARRMRGDDHRPRRRHRRRHGREGGRAGARHLHAGPASPPSRAKTGQRNGRCN